MAFHVHNKTGLVVEAQLQHGNFDYSPIEGQLVQGVRNQYNVVTKDGTETAINAAEFELFYTAVSNDEAIRLLKSQEKSGAATSIVGMLNKIKAEIDADTAGIYTVGALNDASDNVSSITDMLLADLDKEKIEDDKYPDEDEQDDQYEDNEEYDEEN